MRSIDVSRTLALSTALMLALGSIGCGSEQNSTATSELPNVEASPADEAAEETPDEAAEEAPDEATEEAPDEESPPVEEPDTEASDTEEE